MITDEQARAVVASMRNAWSGYTPAEVETLLQWARQELARREVEQMIRMCPITDELLASYVFSDAGINGHAMLLDCKEGSVVEMFIDDHHGVSLAQDETDLVALTSLGKLRDSGQLLDLLAALKGGAS